MANPSHPSRFGTHLPVFNMRKSPLDLLSERLKNRLGVSLASSNGVGIEYTNKYEQLALISKIFNVDVGCQ